MMSGPESPWYKAEIGPRLKPVIRRVYETWSGLIDDELIGHLHDIVCDNLSLLPVVARSNGFIA